MLTTPLSPEDTAERYIRPSLRTAFVNLVRGSVIDYIDRFGFQSELLRAMYAVTDGVVGIHGNWKDPGSGMNFLAHNMVCVLGLGVCGLEERGILVVVALVVSEIVVLEIVRVGEFDK